ncbi:HTH-type transcriptional activator CmpR [Corynebacterium provencense]|uniref:HTH-type transcriptional activator CmpR n=2 Tax=Corynebacteriaceae TaxID=1653 RepID=A0A2Z3YMH3_9CORY|nr:HTH-type transcriptional activator CmpR [Corynebacterium provencense]
MQTACNINEMKRQHGLRTVAPMLTNPGISVAQLVYFVSAAEHGSMTAAAEELYVAQSAVSTSVAQLEKRVGTTLFLRHRSKGLELTADGRELLVRARRILSELRDAVDAVNPDALRGHLETACFTTLAPFYLPQIWARLAEEYPGMRTNAVELTCPDALEALKERRIDIALVYDVTTDPAVTFEPLQERPAYVGLSVDHPLAGRSEISLREMAGEPLILLNLPGSREYFLHAFTSHGVTPTVACEFQSFETVRGMVAAGHGYTVLNQVPHHDYTYSGLPIAAVPVAEQVRPLNVSLAYRAGEGLTAKARAFAGVCRAVIRDADPRGPDLQS